MKHQTLKKIKQWLSFSLMMFIIFTIFLKLIEPAFAQTPPFQPQQTQTPQNTLPVGVANPNPPQQTQTGDPNDPFNVIPGGSTPVNTETDYKPLAPLPGLDDPYDTTGECPLGRYLNLMIKLIIGIATVLAMVMIVLGGMEYMTSELISSKEAGKDKIKNAIIGLLIALGAWLILNTINPTLLNVCLGDIPKASLEVGPAPESNEAFVPLSSNALASEEIYCPGSGGAAQLAAIANSFVGKVTYSQSNRNTVNSSIPTLYLDCSSFVKQVYQCAGLSFSGQHTATMFNSGNSINSMSGTTVNGQPLRVGDLLGWKAGQTSKYPGSGHVVMYIGGGQFIEVSGSGGINGAVKRRSINTYASSYRHIIRVP